MKLQLDPAKEGTRLPDILRAALELFVERGIDGTSISDIARAAGVAQGALYRHFKSKEALAWHLFEANLKAYTDELIETVLRPEGARERIRLFVQECLRTCEKDRLLFHFLVLAEHRELQRFRLKHAHPGVIVDRIVADGQKNGELRADERWVLRSVLLGSVHRLCLSRAQGAAPALAPLSQQVFDAVWRAVKA